MRRDGQLCIGDCGGRGRLRGGLLFATRTLTVKTPVPVRGEAELLPELWPVARALSHCERRPGPVARCRQTRNTCMASLSAASLHGRAWPFQRVAPLPPVVPGPGPACAASCARATPAPTHQ